jgi:hypothetical protein
MTQAPRFHIFGSAPLSNLAQSLHNQCSFLHVWRRGRRQRIGADFERLVVLLHHQCSHSSSHPLMLL